MQIRFEDLISGMRLSNDGRMVTLLCQFKYLSVAIVQRLQVIESRTFINPDLK